MKPAQIYTYTVPASGSVRLMVEGSFIKILASTGPVQIGGDFGNLGPVLAGQGLSDTPSKSYTINDLSGAANSVRVLIADRGFIDDRISGEVSVIDGGKVRTLNSSAFMGAVAQIAVASQNSMLQLWNPLGSGKNLIFENLKFSGAAGAPIDMGSSTVALATLSTSLGAKLLGSNVSPVAKLRSQTSVTPAALITQYLTSSYMPTSQVQPYDFREPIVVPPGWGFTIINSTPNSNILASFEWLEDPV